MAHQITWIHETPTIDHHAGKQCQPPPPPLRSAHLRVSRILPRASGTDALLITPAINRSMRRIAIRGHTAKGFARLNTRP